MRPARANRGADEDAPGDRRRPLADVEGGGAEPWLPDQAKIKHPNEEMVASIRATSAVNNGGIRCVACYFDTPDARFGAYAAADRPSCRHREQSQGAQAGPEPEIAILGHQR